MIGAAQGAFDPAVRYTYQRKQFGKPVGTFQGMQHQYAQAAVEIEAAKLLTYNAARYESLRCNACVSPRFRSVKELLRE